MTSVRVYLIVNGRGECRLTKRRPTLNWDEVAYPINVSVPMGWGRIYDDMALSLEIPPPPEPEPIAAGPPDEAERMPAPRLRQGDREL